MKNFPTLCQRVMKSMKAHGYTLSDSNDGIKTQIYIFEPTEDMNETVENILLNTCTTEEHACKDVTKDVKNPTGYQKIFSVFLSHSLTKLYKISVAIPEKKNEVILTLVAT